MGPGHDGCHGGGGKDRLWGGPSSDRLYGGPGFDYCNGQGARGYSAHCETGPRRLIHRLSQDSDRCVLARV